MWWIYGSSNENSIYGPVKNPVNRDKVSGGSSGGSASAIAEKLCNVALGSDTGGSERNPKFPFMVLPIHPQSILHGLIAYGSSFDQIGIFSNNIDETNLISLCILWIIIWCTVSKRKLTTVLFNLLKKLKIGIPYEYLNFEGLDAEIKDKTLSIIDKLKSNGHQIEMKFPYLDYIVPTYYVLTTAKEVPTVKIWWSSFGFRSKFSNDIDSTYKNSRSKVLELKLKEE